MHYNMIYTYLIYYGLKLIKNKDLFIINNFKKIFINEININEFLDKLVFYKFITKYAKYSFLNIKRNNYDEFFKFIKNVEKFNDEDTEDIFIFLMCCYLGFNFTEIKEDSKIGKFLNDFIFKNIQNIMKEYPKIFKKNQYFYDSIFIDMLREIDKQSLIKLIELELFFIEDKNLQKDINKL